MGFLTNLAEMLANLRKNIKEKKLKRLEKQKYKQGIHEGLDHSEAKQAVNKDPEIQKEKEDVKQEKRRTLLIKVINFVVQAVETVVTAIVGILGPIGVIVCLAAVAIIIIVMSLISTLKEPELPDKMQQIPGSGYAVEAQWTEEELGTRGVLLSDYEKNLYRLIMLCKQTADKTYPVKFTDDVKFDTMFLVGISSTETSMTFFKSDKDNRNILEYPSDYEENNLNYGMLGLAASKKVESYYDSTVSAQIRASYKPLTTPLTDPRFIPWGVPMSGKHISNDIKSYISTSSTNAKIDKVMTAFGISANKEKLKKICYWVLAQAQYHGAETDEYEAYISFVCAMWAATSDNDAERDMDKWTFLGGEGNYSESTFRHCFVGSYGAQDIEKNGDFTNITYNTGFKTRMALNGQEIAKPVWGYLHDKFKTNPQYMVAENQMIAFANTISNKSGSGKGARVLNFHYGMNSYLQGRRVMADVQSKLIGGTTTGTVGDNYSIQEQIGVNTLKNMLVTAMKPVGITLYSWGGGRDTYGSKAQGMSPRWYEFYSEQLAKGKAYNYKDFTFLGAPTPFTHKAGLDCSGFVGWVTLNNRGGKGSLIVGGSTMAQNYSNRGWGTFKAATAVTDYKPGDIMSFGNSKNGHVIMVVGPSEKGGVVIVHASPNGVKLSGWNANGKPDGEGGYATAKAYMEKYWPESSNTQNAFNFGGINKSSYMGKYSQMRWNIITSGDAGVYDPDGFRDMTAEQILKIIFNEVP